mgnify:FL=1
MYTAATLLYPHALATSVTLPMEILQAASQTALARSRTGPQVKMLLAAAETGPLTLSSGLTLVPDISFNALPALDLLLLPAIWRNPVPTIRAMASALDILRRYAAAGTRICSVGTGSCLLAEAGLLEAQAATTHWNYFEQFAHRYPNVKLKTRHLITQSGNIYCVGSVNSIADLMVHITEEWFGVGVARAVENQFSPEIRRSFRAAAYQTEADSSHHDESVIEAQQWLREHLGEPLTMGDLAAQVDLSPRTLNRRFRQATGMSPQAYLQGLRINHARELLKHSNLAVAEIAWQLGLQDASYFSQLFRRHCGMSPLRYREAVRGKLFDPQPTPAALE